MKEEFQNGIMYFGDCLDVLQDLPQNSAEIAITSPPYNLQGVNETQYTTATSRAMTNKFDKWYKEIGSEREYQDNQRRMLKLLTAICCSSVFYNHKIRYAWHSRNTYKHKNKIYHPLQWIDHPIWAEIIWDRKGIGNPTRRYHACDERIYQIGRPKKWSNPRALKSIWRITPTTNTKHPCTFPAGLVWNCMQTTTDAGDTIIDPYIGSGTTAIVAIQNKRRFIGIEKNRTYFDAACKRIENEERQLKLF
ncbi:MAG: DNA methyltransferase [Bacteroidota bacterium]|nr:DNA methyltransferase [Bacteroidota bacterium]